MHQASVGFHCPECTRSGAQKVVRTGQLSTEPTVTKVLIGVNVAVSVLMVLTGGDLQQFSGDILRDYGLWGPFVRHGEIYRLVTGGFLHAGPLHIAFNMYALWILGREVERALSRRWLLVTYGVSLLAGSLGVMLLDPNALTVGASGAIFGLFGLIVVVQRSRGINVWTSGLGPVLLINLAITFAIPGISIGGHLGGLAGGAVCGWLMVEVGGRQRREKVALALAVAVGVASFGAAIWVANANAWVI